jgi:hypothetical protein
VERLEVFDGRRTSRAPHDSASDVADDAAEGDHRQLRSETVDGGRRARDELEKPTYFMPLVKLMGEEKRSDVGGCEMSQKRTKRRTTCDRPSSRRETP